MNMMTRRTTHPNPEPVPGYLADLALLRDAGTRPREVIYRALVRCAQHGDKCPPDAVLCDLAGLEALSSVVYHMRKLELLGRISVASYQRGRQVTILATGHKTRPIVGGTPHWRYRSNQPMRVDSNYARVARKGRG